MKPSASGGLPLTSPDAAEPKTVFNASVIFQRHLRHAIKLEKQVIVTISTGL